MALSDIRNEIYAAPTRPCFPIFPCILAIASPLSHARDRFAIQGVVTSGSAPEERGASLAAGIAQWASVIKAAGIRPD